jgi:hypothetical protein
MTLTGLYEVSSIQNTFDLDFLHSNKNVCVIE